MIQNFDNFLSEAKLEHDYKILSDWFYTYKTRICYLSGRAGSGKTILIKYFFHKLLAEDYKKENITYIDLSQEKPVNQRRAFTFEAALIQPATKLLIIDGIYDASGFGDMMERLVVFQSNLERIIVCSRRGISTKWSVSPFLRAETFCMNLSDTELENTANNWCTQKAFKISGIFMKELDSPGLQVYLEAAAVAWRFNRDLLDEVVEVIKPLDYASLQKLTFVNSDSDGLYLDPLLKKALLVLLKGDRLDYLRCRIYDFALRELKTHHHISVHYLNALYTMKMDYVSEKFFIEMLPGSTICIKDRMKEQNLDGWIAAAKAIDQSPGEFMIQLNNEEAGVTLVCKDGKPTAISIMYEIKQQKLSNYLSRSLLYFLKTQDTPFTHLVLFSGYEPENVWALSALARQWTTLHYPKTHILIPNPSPMLVKILEGLAPVRNYDNFSYIPLNLLAGSFSEWLNRSRFLNTSIDEIDKKVLIHAVRKTLPIMGKGADLSNSPLFTLISSTVEMNGDKPVNQNRFRKVLDRTLRQLRRESPRSARLLEVAYIHRSMKIRKMSAELRIPERTIYREIENGLEKIALTVINELKGGAFNNDL